MTVAPVVIPESRLAADFYNDFADGHHDWIFRDAEDWILARDTVK